MHGLRRQAKVGKYRDGSLVEEVQHIAPMLADGCLVALPTPHPGPLSSKAYCLVQRDSLPGAQAQALIDWICAEARLTDSAPA
jgi:DNA-binding transcriptional LysR family regulator